MEWYVAGVLSSLFLAMRSDVNRRYKLDGLRLNLFSNLFLLLMVIPLLFVVPWHTFDVLYYVIAAVVSVIITFTSTIKNNLAAKFNGRVSNMEMPIKIFVLYFFWWLLDPHALERSINNPAQTLGVLLMLILASYALNHMRRGDVGWGIFVQIVPLALLTSMGDAVTKFALDVPNELLYQAIMQFIAITSLGTVLVSVVFVYMKSKFSNTKQAIYWVSPKIYQASLIVGVITGLMLVSFYCALFAAPNPAYVTALWMLTPIWLLIYHKCVKIPDDASPYMGALMVFSAVGLVLITS